MKRILIFLVVAVFLAETHKQHGSDNVIESIIDKNWARWVAQSTDDDFQVDHPVPQLNNHACIHDSHISPYLKQHISEKIAGRKSKIAEEGIMKFEKSKELRKANQWSNFQTALQTRLLQGKNSDEYACNNPGETVTDFVSGTKHQCQDADVLSDNAQKYLRELVLPTLSEAFEEIIQVNAPSGNLVLSKDLDDTTCLVPGVNIPPSFFDQGVPNATFVAFATARPCPNYVVAYAAACNFDVYQETPPILGRPLAGLINFCPVYFHPASNPFEFRGTMKVALHELTHALGFSSEFYNSYTDPNGDHWIDPTITENRSGTSPAGYSYNVAITKLATPSVIQYAKDYFDCSNITGVELEDTGGSGTAGSHWELRVLGDEYMTGFVNPSMPVTGFTLSLFNDMGWYRSNKNMGEYHGWGKGLGCSFVNSRCEAAWSSFQGYWCHPNDDCSPDRKMKGKCLIIEYDSSLPAYYQHFSVPTYGGVLSPADYCPFVGQYNSNPIYCQDPTQSNDNQYFEAYGDQAACFPVSISSGSQMPKCYQVHCVSEDLLQVIVNNQTFNCPTEGGSLNINSVISGGTVDCPPAYMMCTPVSGYTTNATVIGSDGEWSRSSSLVFGTLEFFVAVASMFFFL